MKDDLDIFSVCALDWDKRQCGWCGRVRKGCLSAWGVKLLRGRGYISSLRVSLRHLLNPSAPGVHFPCLRSSRKLLQDQDSYVPPKGKCQLTFEDTRKRPG